MTKMPREYAYETKVHALSFCALGLFVMYLALFGLTINNASRYQSIQSEIGSLTADLSRMEFEYLSKDAKINRELAKSRGFIEAKEIIIVRGATPLVAVASGNR